MAPNSAYFHTDGKVMSQGSVFPLFLKKWEGILHPAVCLVGARIAPL